MVENAPQMQNQPETGGHRDGNVENEKSRSRWLIAFLMAACLLIVMAVGAYFLLGRELFQRPFLIVAVVVAWLGALVGITIGGDTG
jgi:small-conductance mechanosensitive channel